MPSASGEGRETPLPKIKGKDKAEERKKKKGTKIMGLGSWREGDHPLNTTIKTWDLRLKKTNNVLGVLNLMPVAVQVESRKLDETAHSTENWKSRLVGGRGGRRVFC